MRTLTARQRADDHLWRYVSAGRDGGYPLGYCADDGGHPTEAEARACYRRWQREHVEPRGTSSSWVNCGHVDQATAQRDCRDPARNTWTITGDAYALAVLCDEHNTVEDARLALHLADDRAGDAWQS